MKLIWWFVAIVDPNSSSNDYANPEKGFECKAVELNEALNTLTYEGDRDVVREALKVWRTTFPKKV